MIDKLTSPLGSVVLSLNSGFTCTETKEFVTSNLQGSGDDPAFISWFTPKLFNKQRWLIVVISVGMLPSTAHHGQSNKCGLLQILFVRK